VTRHLVSGFVVLSALVAMAWVVSGAMVAHDDNIRQETRALLETKAQQELLARRIFWRWWLVQTNESTGGAPYIHTIEVFAEDHLEACEQRRSEMSEHAAVTAKTVGPHYIERVSHCRGAHLVEHKR
jgi:hypothetical protein